MVTRVGRTYTAAGEYASALGGAAVPAFLLCVTTALTALALLLPAASPAAAPGDRLWERTYGTAALPAQFVDVAVRRDGGAYAVGRRLTQDFQYAMLLVRHTAQGQRVWRREWGTRWDTLDMRVLTDPSGGVYVAGSCGTSTPGLTSIVAHRYASTGKRLWTRRYTGSFGGENRAVDAITDASGNLYVTGESPGPGGLRGTVTLKYSPQGALRWVQRVDAHTTGPGVVAVTPAGVRLNGDLDALVAYTVVSSAHWTVTVRYDDGDGTVLGRSTDFIIQGTETRASCLDVRGGVVVVGGWYKPQEEATSYHGEMYAERYDAGLMPVWITTVATQGHGTEECTAVRIAGDGDVVAAGRSLGGWGGDIFCATLARIDPAGTLEWAWQYNPTSGGWSTAQDVALSGGRSYVTGSTTTTAQGKHAILTAALDSTGARTWRALRPATGGASGSALALARGCVYAAGYAGPRAVLLKYAR